MKVSVLSINQKLMKTHEAKIKSSRNMQVYMVIYLFKERENCSGNGSTCICKICIQDIQTK